MSKQTLVVIIYEPEYSKGQFVLVRGDWPKFRHKFVWCGRSMGWQPFETTSNAFYRFFRSEETASRAAERYITLPVQRKAGQRGK